MSEGYPADRTGSADRRSLQRLHERGRQALRSHPADRRGLGNVRQPAQADPRGPKPPACRSSSFPITAPATMTTMAGSTSTCSSRRASRCAPLEAGSRGRGVQRGIRPEAGRCGRQGALGAERLRQHRSRSPAQAARHPEDHFGRPDRQQLHRVDPPATAWSSATTSRWCRMPPAAFSPEGMVAAATNAPIVCARHPEDRRPAGPVSERVPMTYLSINPFTEEPIAAFAEHSDAGTGRNPCAGRHDVSRRLAEAPLRRPKGGPEAGRSDPARAS